MRSALPLALAVALLAGCQREDRSFRPNPVPSESAEQVSLSDLSPGPKPPTVYTTGKGDEFEKNAYHLSQGKQLFRWMNCNGCHANGGGGIGPALIDDVWTYGGSIEQIVHTIREGRPNGMPSFRGKIPDDQIWEIAAYVRSMSGNVASDVAPNRDDHMHPRPSENRAPKSPPVEGGTFPPSGQMPQ